MITIAGFITLLVLLLIVKKQVKQKKAAYTILDKQNTEIKKSREDLLVAKEKAEESDKLKSVFLANISHELRTPLNGILGFTDVLRTELTEFEYKDMANIIHNSGNRLLDTLNSIIDLSIIESQKMEIEFTEIKLFDWINEQCGLFMASASSKNLDLIAEVEDETKVIYSDRRLLTNLLNNLIDNAIKYTYEGGINIRASVINTLGNTRLKLEVIDTGIGIEEHKVHRIFDKFRQASEGHSRRFEGAGLGLTLCQKYVEILGGEISLKSRVDYGSHFTVLIPVK
jgi:signal transduction histidine kinase